MRKSMLLSLLDDCAETRALTPHRAAVIPASVRDVLEVESNGSHQLMVTSRLLLRWFQQSVQLDVPIAVGVRNGGW